MRLIDLLVEKIIGTVACRIFICYLIGFSFVLQAVIESIPLKQQIFCELEKACPPHCILASNTSTIDLNKIGEKTKSQDRIVGAHFFR